MTTKVKAWGNSCAIRIPAEILKEAGIQMEDKLYIRVKGTDIILTKMCRHKLLDERIAEYGGKFEVAADFDWGEPKGREIW